MFHENLKLEREAKGITQEQLAKEVNVVRQTVSKWERGLSMPDVDLLMGIAKALDCTIDKLLGCATEMDMSEMAVQLAMINQQLALKNRREERVYSIVALILKIFAGLFIAYILVILALLIGGIAMFSGLTDDGVSSHTYVANESFVEGYMPNE